MYRLRNAYTMLELVFVIVILGIVASIGSEIIANVYENYIIQRAQHKASLKTELASLQIANRLRNAIPGTVYRIKNDDSLEAIDTVLTDSGSTYIGLQWVGSDGDSFEAVDTDANRLPGWSGFIDVDDPATDTNHLKTRGSALSLTDNIIQNLSPAGHDITDAYIYFPSDPVEYQVASVNNDIITLVSAASKTIKEHYKLAWSSYALVVENDGDLNLYYDFPATRATPRGNTKQLLLKNVVTFKFKGAGQTLRFKICVNEPIGKDNNITSCKEKAVF